MTQVENIIEEKEIIRMRIVDLIQTKRDGGELTSEEIDFLLQGYLRGEVPDYQVSALMMAIYFSGLSDIELVGWIESMTRMAAPVDLSDISGPKISKQG